MKRASPTSFGQPLPNFGEAQSKKANLAGPPEGQGEQWTCKECQNVNWPLRSSCKRCNAPGPWTCPVCDNRNFQGRMECNRKSCRQPRPGALGASDPPGSWSCKGCQNMNWPLRTKCKKCEMPREEGDLNYHGFCAASGQNPPGSWICTGCQNTNWPLRTSCKKCSASREFVDGGAPPPPTLSSNLQAFQRSNVPAAAMLPSSFNSNTGGGQNPPGSWICSGCQNVNWPLRTSCKKCSASRELVDSDASLHSSNPQAFQRSSVRAAAPMPSNAVHPPGSWTCNSCGNTNWPLRTQCKKCAAPKQDDGAESSNAAPAGSWACPACSNVNWPLRTFCNKKGCGFQKPQ